LGNSHFEFSTDGIFCDGCGDNPAWFVDEASEEGFIGDVCDRVESGGIVDDDFGLRTGLRRGDLSGDWLGWGSMMVMMMGT
jgi:hypothetical protein